MIVLNKDSWLTTTLQRDAFRATSTGEAVSDADHTVIRGLSERSFVYSKVPIGEIEEVRKFEKLGFHIMETALTFELRGDLPASKSKEGVLVREATTTDRAAVGDIARSSFVYSRFHKDEKITDFADQIKKEWAENFFLGKRGDKMVVAEYQGRLAGFLQLLEPQAGTLVIDLIAVNESARGKGLSTAMITFAHNHLGKYEVVRVGTQANNVASVRLYEGLGFRLVEAAYVLHYHHGNKPS